MLLLAWYLTGMPSVRSFDSEVTFTSGLDSSNVDTRGSLLCTLLLSEPGVKLSPEFQELGSCILAQAIMPHVR